jgi:hypothetical protein
MSNRRKRRPAIVRTMQAYRCPDCDSITRRPRRVGPNEWRVQVLHDDTCPGLTGIVPLPIALIDFKDEAS